jgi:hypothetical protein
MSNEEGSLGSKILVARVRECDYTGKPKSGGLGYFFSVREGVPVLGEGEVHYDWNRQEWKWADVEAELLESGYYGVSLTVGIAPKRGAKPGVWYGPARFKLRYQEPFLVDVVDDKMRGIALDVARSTVSARFGAADIVDLTDRSVMDPWIDISRLLDRCERENESKLAERRKMRRSV